MLACTAISDLFSGVVSVLMSFLSRSSVGRSTRRRDARAGAGAERKGGESRRVQKEARRQRNEKKEKKAGAATKTVTYKHQEKKKSVRDTHCLANFVGGRPHLDKKEGATP